MFANPSHYPVTPDSQGTVTTTNNKSAADTTNMTPSTPPQAPSSATTTTMSAPPEGIFRSFEDLMGSVQKVSKEQGFGIVKLRASNYREGKPTRFDLVCDRGGVKYNSTAKKRNPSTRKIDCPFRAKAVCEVQLGNQWRFAVQDSRHNHEARVTAGTPNQEGAAPLSAGLRSLTLKVDKMQHDLTAFMSRMERTLDAMDKKLDNLEGQRGSYEHRFSNLDQRLQNLEGPRMDGMGMDDVETRLLASSIV